MRDNLLKAFLPTIIRFVLPALVGAGGTLLVQYGWLDQSQLEAIMLILEE